MNARTKRPLKRLVLVMTPLLFLSGRAGLNTSNVYQAWQKQAYSAYQMPVPSKVSFRPAFMRTLAIPGRPPFSQAATVQSTHAQPGQARQVAARPQVTADESQFIKSFYGL